MTQTVTLAVTLLLKMTGFFWHSNPGDSHGSCNMHWVRWDVAFPMLDLHFWVDSGSGTMIRCTRVELVKPSCQPHL